MTLAHQPRLFPLASPVLPASEWCQRWTGGTHSWRHRSDGGFDPGRYSVTPLEETTAKQFIVTNHYSGTYPAALARWGLWEEGRRLVGAAVLAVPMAATVLTNVFPRLQPCAESAELARFVLVDDVAANGESWFLAQTFARAAQAGWKGVVSFSDPVARHVAGRLVFPGHIGTIYQAANAIYTGRATPRTAVVLPDGRILTARSAQKVRAGERGHHHIEARLVALGAQPRRGRTTGAAWLGQALDQIGATRLRHSGNHRYAFPIGTTRAARANVQIAGAGHPYPKRNTLSQPRSRPNP